MKDIYIESTKKTPKVEIIVEKGLVKMEGRSLPEDVRKFYYPLLKEFLGILNEWKTSNIDNFEFHINLDYFNSSSAKFILDFIEEYKQLRDSGKNITLKWYYKEEDYDLKDAGIQFSEMSGLEFEYIELEDDDDDE